MNTQKVSSLVAASVGGFFGFLIGLWVSSTATGQGYQFFPLYAGAAAFVTTGVFWWFLVARPGIYRIFRGAAAGVLAGLAGHYLCWYLLILRNNICYLLFNGCRGSLGEPPVDLFNGLWGAAVLSLGSLFFLGWLTILLGGAVGAVLAAFFHRRPH